MSRHFERKISLFVTSYLVLTPISPNAIAARVKRYGEEHQNTKRAMEEIVKLYEEWGKPEKAEEWRGQG